MFIIDNHAPFRLWRKKNLVKYQKVSKYYDHNCSLKALKKNFYRVASTLFCWIKHASIED